MKYQKYFDRKLKKHCWRFDFTIGGQRCRRGGFATKQEAERVVITLRARFDQHRYGLAGPPDAHTLKQLLDRRAADPRAAKRRQAIQGLRWFVALLGERTLIRTINRASILQFREHLERERRRKASTVQQYCHYIGAALRAATEYFSDLADWEPPRIASVRIEPSRDRVLRAAELGALWTAFDGPRRRLEAEKGMEARRIAGDIVRLALLVPGRRGEILALRPEDINLDWMTITIRSPKVNTVREIPLSEHALQILDRYQKPKGNPFFTLSEQALLRNLQKASADTGILYGSRVRGGWVFHDLRHTAASVMSSSGIDHSTTAFLLGHKLPGMTYRYIHPSLDAQRRAVSALEAFCTSIEAFKRNSMTG